MKILFAISTKKRTYISGFKGKPRYTIMCILTALINSSLNELSEEDVLRCVEVAANMKKDSNK